MKINTPNFWKKKSIISYLLFALSLIYFLYYLYRKYIIKPTRVPAKVISIGNITVGGSGKTPTAILINNILQNLGFRTAFVSSGYGRASKELLQVDPLNSSYLDVGDEPLILSKYAPVWVNKRRDIAALEAINTDNANVIIMDDGMQHPYLHKDLSILVIDSDYMFGNELLLPAGPLRQTIYSGLENTDIAIIIGKNNNYLEKLLSNKPFFYAKTNLSTKQDITSKNIVAFSGLAHNNKFLNDLKSFLPDKNLIKFFNFPDHYQYSDLDIKNIIDYAQNNNAQILTTEKDYVKLNNRSLRKSINDEQNNLIIPVYLDLNIEEENNLKKMLSNYTSDK